MSHDARFMCGLTLILVPTIVYGGLTILGIIRTILTPEQVSFYRVGHAHAGVLAILSLFIQILLGR